MVKVDGEQRLIEGSIELAGGHRGVSDPIGGTMEVLNSLRRVGKLLEVSQKQTSCQSYPTHR